MITPVKEWEITKRYTDFEDFQKKMKLILQAKGLPTNLPFPKKFLFSNFNEKKLADRRKGLEEYLNRLSELLNLVEFPEACIFLEMEEFTKTLLSSLDYEEKKAEVVENGIIHDEEDDPITCSIRKEEVKIKDFLKKMNTEPLSIAKAVAEFDSYFFENEVQLKKKEIKLLLWGDSFWKGMLYFCGDSKRNFIASSSCLQLFSKFIKFEYNSEEADKFLKVYGMTDPIIIKKMNLGNYIKGITTLDGGGLLALYYYLKCNTRGVSEPSEVLDDAESIEEYEKWLKNKVMCGK